ncbi:unnamed protein product [Cylicocyclus nassatus]|uniref:Uncharacterized protein n=1 Tax=Cylicocyclus nassatus TaxID=53992 RepID=A0AA36H948_CYLNA|nr:unnamed protein product [Cylicocyclus nassatus]
MVWLLFVLLSAVYVRAANTRLDKLTEAAMGLLEESNLGVNVRQCSCNEDADCVKVMQSQAKECADSCWNKFSEITSSPQQLYNCVSTKMPVISNFIRCMSSHLKSCVNSPTGPQVPKVDLRKLFDSLEQKVLASRAELLSQGLVTGMKPIAEAAVKFGTCVKQCFVYDKNSEGFCYDGKGCQPSITQKNLRTSLRICLAQTGWKTHAYDLCECARKAGVEGLDDVCSLLSTIRGSKHS